MNSAFVFLLSVLHALVVTIASPVASPVVQRSDVARAAHETEFAQWRASSATVPEQAVRVPLRTATSVVLRTSAPLPFGRPNALPHAVVTRDAFATVVTEHARHVETDLHRLASRGSVLPYFPTAPPRSA